MSPPGNIPTNPAPQAANVPERDRADDWARPEYLAVSPTFAAALGACVEFQGRDRRRVKREMRKAMRAMSPKVNRGEAVMDDKKTLSVAEAAKHLGFSLSYLYHLRATHEGPAETSPASARYFAADLDAWKANRETKRRHKGLPCPRRWPGSDEERTLVKMRADGCTFQEIGARFGVTEARAWQVLRDAKARRTASQKQERPVTEDRLIRLSEVLKVTGLQKSSLYTRIKEGAFPAPAKIGSASCWSSNEVQAWVRAQLDTRRVEPTQPDPAPPLAPGQKPFIIGYRDEPDFVWLYE